MAEDLAPMSNEAPPVDQPASQPEPTTQSKILKWDEIFSWNSVGYWIALLVGIWGALMGSGDYDAVNTFFVLAGILFIVQWGRATSIHQPYRRPLAFSIGLLSALITIGIALRWTLHKASEARIQAQTQRDQSKQLNLIPGLNTSIATLSSNLQAAEIGRQVDAAYLKAKLEDAYTANDDLRKFAPAIMKMAQTSAEFTQKQYEQKTLDNRHLRDMTTGVVKRLRDLEAQYQVASRQSTDAVWSAQVARSQEMTKAGKSLDEMRQQATSDQQQYMATYTQLRNQYEQAYRNTVMGDAQYCRRELVNRVSEDGLMPREKSKAIAIDGFLAGPSPIGDAADYLDALLRKLSP